MAIANLENITVVDSADGASQVVTTDLVLYDVIRWVSTAAVGAGDKVEITDAAGNLVFRAVSETATPVDHESRAPLKIKGVTVAFTDTSSGVLFLYHDINRS